MLQEQIKAALRQAAQEIIEQTGAQRVTEQLLNYPRRIREQQVEVARAKRALEEAKANLEQARAVIMAAVTEEKINSSDKPRFSNEKAREAEVTRRMATDAYYLAAKEVYHQREDEYNAALFDKTQLEQEFGAVRDISQMVTAQINLIAGVNR